ncbi:MAG: chemotaxis protein CheW [Nitrospirota bacterium]
MDLIDIRKKAKEAKAAKEAKEAEAKVPPVPEPEVPRVPGPAPARESAVKKTERRHEKAAIQAVSVADAVKPATAPSPVAEEAAPEEIRKEAEISAAPAAEVKTESSGKMELLAFMLGDEEYALKMEEAREIIRWRKPTKVPRSPEYIIGIISLRGIILPVFDVKKRLGLGELKPTRYTRIVVVSDGGSLSGMVVDRITGVTAVPEKGIESAPAVIDGNEAEYIEGVGRAEDRLLILIRASRALSA